MSGADVSEPTSGVEPVAIGAVPDDLDLAPVGVATVLGRWADHGDVDVLDDSPYRYRLSA